MIDTSILAFTLAAALVTITPGPDTFLVIMNTLQRGFRQGMATALGILSGGFFHAALFAFGVAQVLVYSPTIFLMVKLIGAAYLLYLGIGALRSAFKRKAKEATHEASTHTPSQATTVIEQAELQSWKAAFIQGAITNAFNPKVAVFYLAFLPQFMQATDPIALKSAMLIGIHYALGAVWLTSVALFVTQFNSLLRTPIFQRILEGTVGAIMTFFGIKLALATAK